MIPYQCAMLLPALLGLTISPGFTDDLHTIGPHPTRGWSLGGVDDTSHFACLTDLNNNAWFASFDCSILANEMPNSPNNITNSDDLICPKHD
jgi:hypothetical protein